MNLSAAILPVTPSRCATTQGKNLARDAGAKSEAPSEFGELFAEMDQPAGPKGSGTDESKKLGREANSRSTGRGAKRCSHSDDADEEATKTAKKAVTENLLPLVEAVEVSSAQPMPMVAGVALENASASEEGAESGETNPAVCAPTNEEFLLADAAARSVRAIPLAGADGQPTTKAKREISGEAETAIATSMSANGPDAEMGEKKGSALPGRNAGSVAAERAPKSKAEPAADFAEKTPTSSAAAKLEKKAGSKNFLDNDSESVVEQRKPIGINVAKPQAVMSSTSSSHFSESLLGRQGVQRLSEASSDFNLPTSTATETITKSEAHHAVEAVLEAGEKFTVDGQRAVNVQFSLSGEDLSVRIELHGGRVHTTFQTDSAELRGVLAHEWQALSTANAERTHRYADPVFVANGASTSAGNHGENQGSGRGREAQAPESFQLFGSARSTTSHAESASLSSLSSHPTIPATALHLHTFA